MEIIIHIETRKIDKNLQLAIEEYTKRTSPFCKVNIKLYKTLDKINFKTGSKVYNVTPGSQSPSSEGLAQLIEFNNLNGISCIEFLIRNCNNCDKDQNKSQYIEAENFNISSFELSPDLTTVVLAEQIYRAYTIMNNITYHK